jgi:KDO2-lipid IV(A) lauroyltransferase
MTRLLKVFSRLPLPVLHGLGVVLGWLIFLGAPRRRAKLVDNLRKSGLADTPRALRRLLVATIAESGKGIMELAAIWMRPLDDVVRLVRETRGWEHIEAAQRAGRGILLIGPHIGCFELISLYYAARAPFTAMFKPPKDAALAAAMLAGRQRGQARLVPTDLSGVRALLAALRRHEAVGVLPDNVASAGEGAWALFFGRPAYTPTLVASLQRKTGAAAFFVAAERLSWGRGYRLHVFPLDGELPADRAAAARAINRGVEDVVRRFPAQYMWGYNMHKKPGGAPPVPETLARAA